MSPLDTQLIIRKIKLIEYDLDLLLPISKQTLDAYLSNEMQQLQVERLLERIIGRLIDINFHILKEKYQTVPVDYFKSFVTMGEKGEVDSHLAESMAKTAGLRNILAHEYDVIDHTRIFQLLPIAAQQIPKYLNSFVQN